MDFSLLHAAGEAFVAMANPYRLMMVAVGVVMGLVLGILPGIGGIAGIALLLPFTFGLDPYTALALLLGLAATTSTGDPIPAILFGVPGGAGSAATVLDGQPMARRGEGGRALSAAYMSSMLGGLFGALVLALVLPILRPIMLHVNSPELLAFSMLGIAMVAVLSGSAPLRGMTAAALGLMLSMIGPDPQTSTLRWTFGSLYLWEGLPLVPAVLGIFALPELCDLLISRTAVTTKTSYSAKTGMWQGARDCFRNWWLILRCSWLGAALSSVPGISGSVVDWLCYAHAIRTEKGAAQTFGKGDVRGVIASESANNAREGGALIPTILFGVPGSAGMAILLSAFLIQGIIPGPDMVTKNLNITYSMVWTIALANILGAGLCYAFSGQFARLATLRYTLILPVVLSIIYIGAFQGQRSWGDLYALLIFGVLGWVMKQAKWPRPPLILGMVLGEIVERYMFISVQRYGISWMSRPAVILLIALAFVQLVRPLYQEIKAQGGIGNMAREFGRPHFRLGDLFYMFMIAVLGFMLIEALQWSFAAKIVPIIVGSMGLAFGIMGLLNRIFRNPDAVRVQSLKDAAQEETQTRIHMDIQSDTDDLPRRTIVARAGIFFGYLVAFMASMATIGLIPTVPLFVVAFMRIENREKWRLCLSMAAIMMVLIYIVFDRLLMIPWPPTLLGNWFPALEIIPSV